MSDRPRQPADAALTTGKAKKEILDYARRIRREGPWLARRHRSRLGEVVLWSLGDALRALDEALSAPTPDHSEIRARAHAADAMIERHLGFARKSHTRRNIESISAALIIAFFIRAFLFEPYRIPSGSMLPTLAVGDYLFVSKFTYGLKIPFMDTVIASWRKPKKGEIVIFEHPKPEENREILIKRVVAEPGDRVRLVENVLLINGEPYGQARVVTRTAPCFLTPGQTCASVAMGPEGQLVRSAGCACEIVELNDGVDKTWLTQHVAPGNTCECSVPDDNASCIPFVGGSSAPPGARTLVENRGDWPFLSDPEFLRGWPWDGSLGAAWRASLPTGEIEMTVPPDHVMVMGDNRDNSADSRYWGLVPISLVRGKAMFIWLNTSSPGRMFHLVH